MKFSHKNLQAIIMRLIREPFLIEKFFANLHSEDFVNGQQDIKKQALGRLVDVLLSYYRENNLDRLNIDSFHARLQLYADGEVNDEARNQFDEMLADNEILDSSKNDGILEVFLELIQRNMTQRWFADFKVQFARNEMSSAIVKGREFFEKLELVKIKDEVDFDYAEINELFSEQSDPTKSLATGLPDIDNSLCGGMEPSTLTIWVAISGGGKSMTTSHCVQACIRQQKYAHVTVVEDRKKTFLPRVLSGLCGIPAKRLRKEFNTLTPEEKKQFDHAVACMKKFIKIDFLYDTSVSEVHQRKLAWRRYCQLHNLPLPEVDILDYSGHIACTANGDKTHEKYLAAYTARKNYCLKYGVIGIDFAQVNRAGAQKVDDVITMADLASSFDLARVCDNIFTINRNDEQKQKNEAVIYIGKIRDGDISGNKYAVETDFDYGRYNFGFAINLSQVTPSSTGRK